MRTRALVSRRAGDEPKPVEVELDVSGLRDDELLVQIVAAGVCHTDLRAAEGQFYISHPHVAGHEGCGVVVQAGAKATDFREGDHVCRAVPGIADRRRCC